MALTKQLQHVPALIKEVLLQDDTIAAWAESFTNKQHAIFLGRGAMYPVALEGALKMKEISYRCWHLLFTLFHCNCWLIMWRY